MPSDQTQARRERVLELFAKPDMAIAKRLVEERFFGAAPRTPADRTRHLDTARRTVGKDKDWWRAEWKQQKRELTAENARMDTEEYVARLKSRLGDVEEVLEDGLVKSTPRVQAIETAVRIEQAIAKARGIDQAAPADLEGGDGARVPFFGILMSTEKVSPAVRKQIDEWTKRKRE